MAVLVNVITKMDTDCISTIDDVSFLNKEV